MFPSERLRHFLKMTNVNFFYTVQYEYKKLENRNCLIVNELHSLGSDGSSNYENCMEWCNKNAQCAGFTVYRKTCYFKSYACANDLSTGSLLFLKQGNKVNQDINLKDPMKLFTEIYF